jgi:putative nucleotidyltransferase with HDIG domain
MPKHLLFVDDERMVLDGLRRALHGMRDEWQMKFVDGPAAALEALDQEPFDAIISDMRMPRMDGAELLQRVKERHGEVVRIVLSGQSSRETVLRSIAPAHQFLSKPCDIQELKRRLSQAFLTRDLLRDASLASVVSRLHSIPSLPTVYNELSAALESEDTSLAQIETIISKDVGMAAKILQLANSAFIGARGTVSSLRTAVSLIGAETVRSLTLSIHVFSQFDRHCSAGTYLPVLWEHSVAVAALAQRIAQLETGSKPLAEECFTAGLLHDVGKIVLIAEMPEYRKVIAGMNTNTRSIRAVEAECVGCPHEQVGAYLMSIWGLPVSIVQAVQFHHAPSETATTGFSALTAVHCADAIVSGLDKSPLNHDLELDRAHLEDLGLAEKPAIWQGLIEPSLSAAGDEDGRLSCNVFSSCDTAVLGPRGSQTNVTAST